MCGIDANQEATVQYQSCFPSLRNQIHNAPDIDLKYDPGNSTQSTKSNYSNYFITVPVTFLEVSRQFVALKRTFARVRNQI